MTQASKNKEPKQKNDSFESVARDLGCDESQQALDDALDSLDVKVIKEEEKKEED